MKGIGDKEFGLVCRAGSLWYSGQSKEDTGRDKEDGPVCRAWHGISDKKDGLACRAGSL